MKPKIIADGVKWIGVVDWNQRMFDSLISLPDGTSYNAHVYRLRQRDIKGFQPLQVRRFFLLERCGQLGTRLRGQGRDAPVRLKARIAHRAFSSQKAPAKARVRPGR